LNLVFTSYVLTKSYKKTDFCLAYVKRQKSILLCSLFTKLFFVFFAQPTKNVSFFMKLYVRTHNMKIHMRMVFPNFFNIFKSIF
jgi:hypothetical protein